MSQIKNLAEPRLRCNGKSNSVDADADADVDGSCVFSASFDVSRIDFILLRSIEYILDFY